MSLVDRLKTPPAPEPSRTRLDAWIDSLPDDSREAVQAAILNPAWSHVALRAVLIAEGAPKVADTTFGVWRRKHGYTS